MTLQIINIELSLDISSYHNCVISDHCKLSFYCRIIKGTLSIIIIVQNKCITNYHLQIITLFYQLSHGISNYHHRFIIGQYN
jgi:hypothetical protein